MNYFEGKNRVGCNVCLILRAQLEIGENEPSAAGNSKSNNERQERYHGKDESKIHVSRRHGWNVYNASGLLFLVAFSLLCGISWADSKPCILNINGTRDCPFSRDRPIFVEYGNTPKMVCKREWSLTKQPLHGRLVSDLVVVLNNKIVQPLTDFGLNEVRLPLNTLPPSTNTFECRLKLHNDRRGKYEVIYRSTISIGFKPKKPRNFKCVSHNLEKLVCTWDPEPNSVPTRFFLRVSPPGKSSFVCSGSQAGSKIPPNSCVWDTSMNPPYSPTNENYTFLLDEENTLGQESFTYNFHQWENVISSKPVNLRVLNDTDSSALLHWSIPIPMRNFPPGLHYRVSYQAQSDNPKTWHTIDVTDKTHATEINFNLTDLELANTVYNVRVSIKSSLAVGEDMWGQPAETTFRTTMSPASLPPRTDIGSFETVGDGDKRDVYVYWQRIPRFPDDGNSLPYKVVRVEENGRRLDLQPDEITKTYAKFTGIGSNGISLDIAAADRVAANGPTTTVHIPSKLETPMKPIVHTKTAFGGGIYELSWNSSNIQGITNYTIFWCENARDRPYQCTGHLDWVHVPGSTHMYNITVPDPKKTYQFAIAANTARTSSGMVWFSGMTTLSNDVGKPKSVGISRIRSDSAEIRWELPYSGRIGIVEGFNIYYCPVQSSHNCNGAKMKKFVKGDQHLMVGALHGLQPDTTYKSTVTVLSKTGEGPHSDPLYFTTLQARPDPSLVEKNVQTAIEKSSSGVKDYIKDLLKQCDVALDGKLNEIDKLHSMINDSVTQISNLELTISALNAKLDSLTVSIKQRDKALGDKLNSIDEFNARITDSVTQVFNLTLPIAALNVKLDSLSESTKQRDEALGRKLNRIDELDARITNAVNQVSNLTLPISAVNAKLNSLSDSIEKRDKAFDDKLNGMVELNSRITNGVTQVSNLTLPISAVNVKLDALSESTKQRDEALNRKLDGIDQLDSRITNVVTQVSNLTLPISAFNDKLDSLSYSIKQRDKALNDKLNSIDKLSSRINNSVIEVSNLGQTISAFNVELVSLSKENCQLRENLTQCNLDAEFSLGQIKYS